jgi:hypothetical protein
MSVAKRRCSVSASPVANGDHHRVAAKKLPHQAPPMATSVHSFVLTVFRARARTRARARARSLNFSIVAFRDAQFHDRAGFSYREDGERESRTMESKDGSDSRGGNRHTASLESRSSTSTSTAALSTSTRESDRVSARTPSIFKLRSSDVERESFGPLRRSLVHELHQALDRWNRSRFALEPPDA